MASSRLWVLTPRSSNLKIQAYHRVRKLWIPEPPALIPLSTSRLAGFEKTLDSKPGIILPESPPPTQTVLLWPTQLSIAGPAKLPLLPRGEIPGAVAGELETLLPWNIEDCQTAIHAVRRDQTWEIYGWATPRRWLENALSVLATYGLEPKYILPESFFLLLFRETDPALPRTNEFLSAPSGERTLVMTLRNGNPCRETIAETKGENTDNSVCMDLLVASVLMDSAEEAFLWTHPEAALPPRSS
ncbi:hypothetical protein [Leptospirillum ferriphilum]|uniref:Uncharacterized protein n=1 Tax=Leptospirillum ferriphilum (strain ML-04) TaxID=1048260 RepID=J9ZAM9_LEPFM|nr:hypothetical protein [Leptospirillum ferriphilum]AFS53196.1 hypothetical protein LFML04_0964 [Leptospirillum ferriphilum ML-04]